MARRAATPARPSRSRGFSLVEILIVLAIIGILANLAIPAYFEFVRRTRATSIINDFTVLRHEVVRFQSDQGAWPRGAGWGREPRDLRPYLEGKMRFDHGSFEYRLRNRMRLPQGRRPWRLALQVRGDRRILSKVDRLWDEPLYRRSNRRSTTITFVLAR